MIVEYLITLTIKKLRMNRQKLEIFFAKFQAPFSQKIFNIQLYISFNGAVGSADLKISKSALLSLNDHNFSNTEPIYTK